VDHVALLLRQPFEAVLAVLVGFRERAVAEAEDRADADAGQRLAGRRVLHDALDHLARHDDEGEVGAYRIGCCPRMRSSGGVCAVAPSL